MSAQMMDGPAAHTPTLVSTFPLVTSFLVFVPCSSKLPGIYHGHPTVSAGGIQGLGCELCF